MGDRQYVIELDGLLYRYRRGSLEPIAGLQDVHGDAWVLSDFEGSVSRTMTVEAPSKYAEVMVRKKLQESGEFDEPLSVLTHWKKKRDARMTDIHFTAVPTRLFHRRLEETKAHQDSLLIYPLSSVLLGALKRFHRKAPTAIVFQHNRFADLIVADRGRVLYANRCVAFDQSEEQNASLWAMVGSDIENVERENRTQVKTILTLSWLDTRIPPKWLEEMGERVRSMEGREVSCRGESLQISLPRALDAHSGFGSVSGRTERMAFWCGRMLPRLWPSLLLGTLAFLTAGVLYERKAGSMEKGLHAVRTELIRTRHETPVQEIPYKDVFAFVGEMVKTVKTPSYKAVLGDLSNALKEPLEAEILKIAYTDEEVVIELFVKGAVPFEAAYRGFQDFYAVMKGKGYLVVEKDFNTSIQASRFLIRMSKRVK